MRKKISAFTAAALLSASVTGSVLADEAAELQALYEDAKGQSLVLALHGLDGLEQFAQVFASSYPEINVEVTVINPSALATRVLTEQRSGVYAWDAFIGALANIEASVIPADGLALMEDYFVLPVATDPSAWLGDIEAKPHVFTFTGWVERSIYANTDRLAELGISIDDLQTFDQLLDPRLAGEIAMRDPGRQNAGSQTIAAAIHEMGDIDGGLQVLKTMLADMDTMVVDNPQQVTNTVLTGEKAVVIGATPNIVSRCQIVGGCTNVERLEMGPYINYRGLVVFNNAPNPEAVKFFVNWVASKEGQEAFVRSWGESNLTGAVSLRRDIAPYEGHGQDIPSDEQVLTLYESTSEAGSALTDQVVNIRRETLGAVE